MAKRRRRSRSWPRRLLLALAAIPLTYLLAALVGSLVPLNAGWREPKHGVTVYLADNGVHADLVLPVRVGALDWSPLVPRSDMADARIDERWIAFGAGERHVYLDTPTWADISPRTALAAAAGGERVMHVEYTAFPRFSARELRLTPEQYRRLWAAIRAEFRLDARGRPVRIGRASVLSTCNTWVAGRLRLAGVKVSAWSPFVQGLVWRYRRAD
jgi:uncharacterized protein (TIGR02117 family)